MSKTEPPLLALLRCRNSNQVAVAVNGCLAWRSGPPVALPAASPAHPTHLHLVRATAPPQYAPDQWEVLSTDAEAIHAVLLNTGIFDQLVGALGERMSKRTGPMKVWINGAGFVPYKWLLTARRHGYEP